MVVGESCWLCLHMLLSLWFVQWIPRGDSKSRSVNGSRNVVRTRKISSLFKMFVSRTSCRSVVTSCVVWFTSIRAITVEWLLQPLVGILGVAKRSHLRFTEQGWVFLCYGSSLGILCIRISRGIYTSISQVKTWCYLGATVGPPMSEYKTCRLIPTTSHTSSGHSRISKV